MKNRLAGIFCLGILSFSAHAQSDQWHRIYGSEEIICSISDCSLTWVGTNHSLVAYNYATGEHMEFNGLNSELDGDVKALTYDPDGNVWACTEDAVYEVVGTSLHKIQVLSDTNTVYEHISDLAVIDQDHLILRIGSDALYTYDVTYDVLTQILYKQYYNIRIASDKSGVVHGVAEYGDKLYIYRWNGGWICIDSLTDIGTESFYYLSDFLVDEEGIDWMSFKPFTYGPGGEGWTFNGGVLTYAQGAWGFLDGDVLGGGNYIGFGKMLQKNASEIYVQRWLFSQLEYVTSLTFDHDLGMPVIKVPDLELPSNYIFDIDPLGRVHYVKSDYLYIDALDEPLNGPFHASFDDALLAADHDKVYYADVADMYLFDIATLRPEADIPEYYSTEAVRALSANGNGHLLITSKSRVIDYDGFTTTKFFPQDFDLVYYESFFYSACMDAENTYCIQTNRYLIRGTPNNWDLIPIPIAYFEDCNHVAIYNGSAYLTAHASVLEWDGTDWNVYDHTNAPFATDEELERICVLPTEKAYAMSSNGLYKIQDHLVTQLDTRMYVDMANAFGSDDIWLATSDSLFRWNNDTLTGAYRVLEVAAGDIAHIAVDGNENVLLNTHTASKDLFVFNPSGTSDYNIEQSPNILHTYDLNCKESYTDNPFDIILYPNPAADELHFYFPDVDPGDFSIGIYDMLGRSVKKYLVADQKAGVPGFVIDIHELNNGMYTLYIVTDKTRGAARFIKM